jgi:hypothetical protein
MNSINDAMQQLLIELNPLNDLGLAAGSSNMDVSSLIRNLLNSGIDKYCQKHNCKRVGFARALSAATKHTISINTLYKYTRANGYRFPVDYIPAFCRLTGDNRLAQLIPKICGLKVMESESAIKIKLANISDLKNTLQNYEQQLKDQLQNKEGIPTRIFIDNGGNLGDSQCHS